MVSQPFDAVRFESGNDFRLNENTTGFLVGDHKANLENGSCNHSVSSLMCDTCRCGNNFCTLHRYAEAHACTYDYKSEGRKLIEQNNPVITAPKLPKI